MTKSICRVCLADTERLMPIFSRIDEDFIARTLAECTAVQILEDDGLPAEICNPCVDELRRLVRFIEKARSSDRELRQRLYGQQPGQSASEQGAQEPCTETSWEQHFVGIRFDGVTHEDEDGGIQMEGDDGRYSPEDSKDDCDVEKRDKLSFLSDHEEDDSSQTQDETDDTLDEKERAMFTVVTVTDEFVCCACLKTFVGEEQLRSHGQKVHHKKRRINSAKTNICDICFRRYSTSTALNGHRRKTNELKRIFECVRCAVRFVDRMRRRHHAHNHPKTKEPPLHQRFTSGTVSDERQQEYAKICCAQACGLSYATEEQLLVHAHTAHRINKIEFSLAEKCEKPFECYVCFKRFSTEISLQRHRQRNYKPFTYQCALCGLKFRGGEALATHERSHRNEKPFACPTCPKSFTSKTVLKAHQLIHSDERPFTCPECGHGFRRKRNLQVHVLSHSDRHPFQCELCPRSFKAKPHLLHHMRTHTGEKPYQCRHCTKSFADHTNRGRHEMSHTGIKPYRCSFCDKSFIRKRLLVEHESTHTGVKPYQCELCHQTFSQKTALKKHQRHERCDFAAIDGQKCVDDSLLAHTEDLPALC